MQWISDNLVLVIAIAAAAVLFFLMLVIAVVLVLRRRRSAAPQPGYADAYPQPPFDSATMRGASPDKGAAAGPTMMPANVASAMPASASPASPTVASPGVSSGAGTRLATPGPVQAPPPFSAPKPFHPVTPPPPAPAQFAPASSPFQPSTPPPSGKSAGPAGGAEKPVTPPTSGGTVLIQRGAAKPKVLGILVEKKDSAKRFDIDKPAVTIGRAPGNHLVVDHPTVSRQHATIKLEGEDYRLYDLGSANGTFVKDQRVRDPITLQDGEIVRFGEVEFIFKRVSLG